MTSATVIDALTYASYRHQRQISPRITPEQWGHVFPNATDMEARWQDELIARTDARAVLAECSRPDATGYSSL